MGNYSLFITACNGADICTINWCNANAELINRVWQLQDARDEAHANTLLALAHFLNDKKLCGYLDENYVVGLCEVSRITTAPMRCTPRIYFEEEGFNRIYFFEFMPGVAAVNIGVRVLKESKEQIELGQAVDKLKQEMYNANRKDAIMSLIQENNFDVRPLKVVEDDKVSLLPTLMTLFGIRPEDANSIEQARAAGIDVERAAHTTLADYWQK